MKNLSQGPFKDEEHPDFMSLTVTEAVVLSPSEIRFRAFASLEFSETGEPLMTPGDFLDSLIQDRPRPRIKARVSWKKCSLLYKYRVSHLLLNLLGLTSILSLPLFAKLRLG